MGDAEGRIPDGELQYLCKLLPSPGRSDPATFFSCIRGYAGEGQVRDERFWVRSADERSLFVGMFHVFASRRLTESRAFSTNVFSCMARISTFPGVCTQYIRRCIIRKCLSFMRTRGRLLKTERCCGSILPILSGISINGDGSSIGSAGGSMPRRFGRICKADEMQTGYSAFVLGEKLAGIGQLLFSKYRGSEWTGVAVWEK